MTTVLAALRPLRTELIGLGGLVVLLLVASAVVIGRLAMFDLPAACLDPGAIGPACAGRQYDATEYQSFANWTTSVTYAATVLPVITGVLLGIAMVAKELDQRTAVLAWSVGPSRRRWLLQRSIPALALIILLGLGSSVLIVELAKARTPGAPVPVDFAYIPVTGLGPAALGVSSFGVTLVIGAMLGRLLPALLSAGAFVLASFLLISQGNDRLMAAESLVTESTVVVNGRILDSLLRTPDGRIISWNDAFPAFADPNTGEPQPGVTQMTRYVPIEIYPQVAARYVLLHLALGLATLTLAFAVVERRSP